MSVGAMSSLVYDIGLHDGRDTGHYLRAGFRVVAIDANPSMCTAAEAHFSGYIRTGQLRIINCGVAEHKGRLEFWVCDDVSEWSSFHRDIASRNGARHHAIIVDCLPIMDIVAEFGVADYMKIDIEGNDRICIAGLSSACAPPYISIEMDHARGDEDIQTLAGLGYRSFKLICQNNTWHQVTRWNKWFYARGPNHPVARHVRQLRSIAADRLRGRRYGESGPWGEETSGSWHSLNHALAVWRSLRELDERLETQGTGWWFDVHARK
jgi:FkbM family methyltransferase